MSIIEEGQEPMPGFSFYQKQKWIRVSAVSEYIRCPRRFFYHYGCGLVPREDRIALIFGEAIHAGLGSLLRFPGDLTKAMQRFLLVWKDRDNLLDPKRTSETAGKLLACWLGQHTGGRSLYNAIEPPKPVTADGLPVLVPTERQSDYEVPFAIDIGLDIPLIGRIDALAHHRDTKELWTVEFKTTSELSTRFFEGFRLNPQALMYNLACRSSGIRTKGTFVEALQVAKTKTDVSLMPVYVQDFHLSEMTKLLRWKVLEMLECEKRRDFPKDFTGCNPYASFGMPGYNCDYMRLCETPDWTTFKDIFVVQHDVPFIVSEKGETTP